ncbi:MAG: histidine phosphatase family protein [Acidimicrobiales bacterium]
MSGIEPPEGFRTSGSVPLGTRIVLVRHGEAYCNALGVVGGPVGCGGLTELGEAQARALRDRLLVSREFDDTVALYTSVLPRAMQTAAIIAPGLPAHLRAQRDCELCELHPGEADGMTWDEVIDTFGGPDWDKDPHQPFAPGGESWMDFYERCERALAALVRRHPGERVILVVHGGVIEQAMKVLERKDPMARLKLRTEHCSLTEIEFDGETRRLLRYNDRAPLAAE